MKRSEEQLCCSFLTWTMKSPPQLTCPVRSSIFKHFVYHSYLILMIWCLNNAYLRASRSETKFKLSNKESLLGAGPRQFRNHTLSVQTSPLPSLPPSRQASLLQSATSFAQRQAATSFHTTLFTSHSFLDKANWYLQTSLSIFSSRLRTWSSLRQPTRNFYGLKVN